MTKQTKPIYETCGHPDCLRDATIGVYRWRPGDTCVNLDKPVAVVCGPHKPTHSSTSSYLRNVKLVTA